MGSYIHTKSLSDKNEQIKYMISLEMIGYFSDEKIQKYPIGLLNWIYPDEGNFKKMKEVINGVYGVITN